MAEAATALRNFWLWKHWFHDDQQPSMEESTIIPLISRYNLLLNELIHENPMLAEFQLLYVQHVQQLVQQLQQGVIPSLVDLADTFPQGMDSPEAKHLLLRYTFFLNQTGKLGRLRGEQLNLLIRLRSRENLLRHIEHTCSKYDADSQQAKEFNTCASYLKNTIHEIEQHLLPLLNSDPSRGGVIHLRWATRVSWLKDAWNWCRRGFKLSIAMVPAGLFGRLQPDKVGTSTLLSRSYF